VTILKVLVFITSLSQPHEHAALRYYENYPTRFTCEAALSHSVDLQAIMKMADKAIHIPHHTVRRATADCVSANDGI
jgi:hypothetical protein